jgi:hypothetical protein
MVLFIILAIIIILAAVCAAAGLFTLAVGYIIAYWDVILLAIIIVWLIKRLIRKIIK